MTKQKTKGAVKLSYDDVIDALTVIINQRESQVVGPISNSEIQAILKIEKNIEVSDQTIRNKGVRKNGYFEKKYPEIFSFQNIGDTRLRGMMIKKQKFLEQVAQSDN